MILDGDILEGAKQNRVINTSILVGAKETVEIPVSCVERGRWNYSSDKFTQSDTIASKNIRFQKAQDIFNTENTVKKMFLWQVKVEFGRK